MAVMFCLECHEALPLPSAGAAPTEIGCPRCGAVYPWPPRGSNARAKPLQVRPGASAPAPGQNLPALLTVEPCPACARPLRLSVDRAGQLATCPRSDCGHTFKFLPQNVGQEVETVEAICSSYAQDYVYSVVFQRPIGSAREYQFQETQKGTGAIDRLAGGNNYDEISQGGTISYNRNYRETAKGALNFGGFSCPWCSSQHVAYCNSCGALTCQGGADGRNLTCPSCGVTGEVAPWNPDATMLTRGATYTPKQAQNRVGRENMDAPAIANDHGRYLLAGVGNLLKLGRKV